MNIYGFDSIAGLLDNTGYLFKLIANERGVVLFPHTTEHRDGAQLVAIAQDWRTPAETRNANDSRTQFSEISSSPNGIHNPGELRQSQLDLPKPGGICHVESIFLGSSEPTAARTHRSRPCPGPGPRSGPKVQNLSELS